MSGSIGHKSISEANSEIDFLYNFKESRLIKVLKIIDKLPVGSFLDLGATQGGLMQRMEEKGWDVHGVDVNPSNVSICGSKGLSVDLCDLMNQDIPCNDNSFDMIFAGEMIEHLVDTDRFLSDIYRSLKSGGSVIVTTPNLASFENRVRLLFGFYPEWVDWCTGEGTGHVRSYTAKILRRQMIKNGFEIESVHGNFVPFVPQSLINDQQLPLLSLFGDLFPTLSQGIIVHAKKL